MESPALVSPVTVRLTAHHVPDPLPNTLHRSGIVQDGGDSPLGGRPHGGLTEGGDNRHGAGVGGWPHGGLTDGGDNGQGVGVGGSPHGGLTDGGDNGQAGGVGGWPHGRLTEGGESGQGVCVGRRQGSDCGGDSRLPGVSQVGGDRGQGRAGADDRGSRGGDRGHPPSSDPTGWHASSGGGQSDAAGGLTDPGELEGLADDRGQCGMFVVGVARHGRVKGCLF